MTFPESLRAYADWCERNPVSQQDSIIDIYGEKAAQAKAIMLADPHAKLHLLPGNSDIVYLDQQFGVLTVKHVLRKHDICNQSIENNMVVSVLKPEFAELVRP
jgi:hypothetical protein